MSSETNQQSYTAGNMDRIVFTTNGVASNATYGTNTIQVHADGYVRITGVVQVQGSLPGQTDSIFIVQVPVPGTVIYSAVSVAGSNSETTLVVDFVAQCSTNDTFDLRYSSTSSGLKTFFGASFTVESVPGE